MNANGKYSNKKNTDIIHYSLFIVFLLWSIYKRFWEDILIV